MTDKGNILWSRSKWSSFFCYLQGKFQVLIKQFTPEMFTGIRIGSHPHLQRRHTHTCQNSSYEQKPRPMYTLQATQVSVAQMVKACLPPWRGFSCREAPITNGAALQEGPNLPQTSDPGEQRGSQKGFLLRSWQH